MEEKKYNKRLIRDSYVDVYYALVSTFLFVGQVLWKEKHNLELCHYSKGYYMVYDCQRLTIDSRHRSVFYTKQPIKQTGHLLIFRYNNPSTLVNRR